jgi:uncharacterized membrane protein YoaK (UPF0700 family)
MNRLDRPRQTLAVGLAGLAGYVDATGFLSGGGYFTSFMSGNTTRLGVDLASDPAVALVPVGLIGGFVAGVTLGVLVAERWPLRRKTAVMTLVLALLVGAALAHGRWPAAFLAASVVAMGALNNVFRRNGEVAIGITYMTGALVRFGQGLAAKLLGQPHEGRLDAGRLWLGLVAGALSGALAIIRLPAAAPWIAASYAALMLFAANAIERRAPQPST